MSVAYSVQQGSFNSRSHIGSDLTLELTSKYRKPFQLTLPRRERSLNLDLISCTALFQLTLPYRERLCRLFCVKSGSGFNSRSHTGSDPTASGASNDSMTFQFTLPYRERYPEKAQYKKEDVFQLKLPRREQLRSLYTPNPLRRFNSHSHVGSNHQAFAAKQALRSFNSRSHVGSNPTYRSRFLIIEVSTHAPT